MRSLVLTCLVAIMTVKAYGSIATAVSDMQTQVVSGTKRWAVRADWRQLTHGWQIDKKGVFLDPYP